MSLNLYTRKGSKIIQYRGTIGPPGNRERLRGSTGTENKANAARHIAEIEARYWKGNFDGPGSILTFDQAAQSFLAAGKSGRFLGPVRGYLKDKLVKDIKPSTIRQMAMKLFPDCSGASRNRLAITPAQSVINHAAESELCSPIRVKRFKAETKVKDPATIEWVHAFRAYAKPHLGAWALFMFCTGARPSEALAVDRDRDLDLQAATVIIRDTKTGNERKAHLPPMLVAELAGLIPVPGCPLFVYRHYDNAMGAWFDAIECAGIQRLTPHCCRHGFATTLLRNGVDVMTVAWLGGWKTAEQVLKTYGHAIKDRTLTDRLIDVKLTRELTHNSLTDDEKSGKHLIHLVKVD